MSIDLARLRQSLLAQPPDGEAVIAANPGLAATQQPFSAGVVIVLPDLPEQVEKPIQLWS